MITSVLDPRTSQRIGGLQAQAAGILNYAQGMYTNPETGHSVPILEAIEKKFIECSLQEESSHEEFDAEVITETLMERCITKYKILNVLDPCTNELLSANEAVRKQIIDTETNAYVDERSGEYVSIREAVRRNLIQAEVSERTERKPLGLTLQNALRLGLFNPDTGKFKDPYTSTQFDLNQAIEKGHINPNGAAIADSNSNGSMTLNEAFKYSIFNKRNGCLDRTRLMMFKARLVEHGKIYKWNFEDAVKCGLLSLKTARYKHQMSNELLSIREAIQRGLIDGDSTIMTSSDLTTTSTLSNKLITLKQALDEMIFFDEHGFVYDLKSGHKLSPSITLEHLFNTRKIFSAFNENTGEIFLPSLGKIVPFERAIRKMKMQDKANTNVVRIFDPKSNKDLVVNDAFERGIIDKTSGMIIDPKSGGLLSIKEAVKRSILSVTGAPVVTGHHDHEIIESAQITSRKNRHQHSSYYDSVNEKRDILTHHHHHNKKKSAAIISNKLKVEDDREYLTVLSDLKLNNDNGVVTNIKQTHEEGTRRIIDNGNVMHKIRSDFKETLIEPGQTPRITSKGQFNKEFIEKI
jgi:dystonin